MEQDKKFRFSPKCLQKSIRRVIYSILIKHFSPIRLAEIEEPGNILYVPAEQSPSSYPAGGNTNGSLHVREGGSNHQNRLCIYNHKCYVHKAIYHSAPCNTDCFNTAWGAHTVGYKAGVKKNEASCKNARKK